MYDETTDVEDDDKGEEEDYNIVGLTKGIECNDQQFSARICVLDMISGAFRNLPNLRMKAESFFICESGCRSDRTESIGLQSVKFTIFNEVLRVRSNFPLFITAMKKK